MTTQIKYYTSLFMHGHKYRLDTEAKDNICNLENLKARHCSMPSGARVLLRA